MLTLPLNAFYLIITVFRLVVNITANIELKLSYYICWCGVYLDRKIKIITHVISLNNGY